MSRWMRALTINDVSTGATPEYPELQPRSYAVSRERVFEAAVATARGMRGWRVTFADAAAGEIRAVAHVFLTPFRDDVTIQVATAALPSGMAGSQGTQPRHRSERLGGPVSGRAGGEVDGRVVVNVRSASRVGRADLGVNARRIRAYLRALDRCLDG